MKIIQLLSIAICLNSFIGNGQNGVCFLPKTDYPLGLNYNPYGIVSADFNGDNYKDIAVANNVPYAVSILLNDGIGGFGLVTNISVSSNPRSIAQNDLNNDGKNDLVTANYGGNNVSVLFGNGSGGFLAPVNFGGINGPAYTTTSDIDKDGKADIITANGGSNSISVFLNTTSNGSLVPGFSAAQSFTMAATPSSIVTADFTNDGNEDVICANSSGLTAFINTSVPGAVSFDNPPLAFPLSSTPQMIIAGDFNNDGYPDAAVSTMSNKVEIFVNTGMPPFLSYYGSISVSGCYGYQAIASADINNDGNTDLIMVDDNSNKAKIFLNDGNVNFTYNTAFSTGGYPYALNCDDLNNDGKPDVFTGNLNTGDVSVLLNTGILPALSISGNTSVCSGNSTSLTASGANTYSWTGGLVNGTPFIPLSTTDYTVNATDINSCTNQAVTTVTVMTIPNLSVHDGTVCAGQSFMISPNGAIAYNFSGGTPLVSPSATTTYTVFGTGANGCLDSITSTVYINQLPSITVNSGTICPGQSFTMNPVGAVTYSYSSGANVVSPNSATTYTVTGTDINGCVNTAMSDVFIYPAVIAGFSASPPSATMANPLINFQDNSVNASSWIWHFGDNGNSTSTLQNPAFTYADTGTYIVCLTSISLNGCSDSICHTVGISDNTSNVEDIGNVKNMEVFPNPAGNYILISGVAQAGNLRLVDIAGNEIMPLAVKIFDGLLHVDVSSLADGIYFFSVSNKGKSVVRKIVIRHN